jgi:hypothetical protein
MVYARGHIAVLLNIKMATGRDFKEHFDLCLKAVIGNTRIH